MLLIFIVLSFFPSDNYIVKSIEIKGNELTKDVTIRREILFKTGDLITKEDAEHSRKRIENIRLFTSVNYDFIIDSNSVKVVYTVYEKFPLFISPVISTDGLNTDKVTYGMKLQHINIAGKNHIIDLTALSGEKSSYSFFYFNPWMLGTDRLSYTFFFNHTTGTNKLLSSEREKNINLGLSFGKGFGPYINTFVSVNYNQKKFDSEHLDIISFNMESSNDILEYSLGLSYDTRDFYNFPTKGNRFGISMTAYNIIDDVSHSTNRLQLSYVGYKSLSDRVIWASKAEYETRFGNPYYYHKIYYNSRNTVRGYQFSKVFGQNAFNLKNEIRYEFLKDFFWSLNLPYVKKYMKNLRTMMYAYSFFDIGNNKNSYDELVNAKPGKGYGLGIGIILPYMKAIRLEFSRDEKNNKFWGIEIGLPF